MFVFVCVCVCVCVFPLYDDVPVPIDDAHVVNVSWQVWSAERKVDGGWVGGWVGPY